jgi:hypothetical protein
LLVETLLKQSRLAATTGEAQVYLAEASKLCRDVMDTPTVQNAPESLAWMQGAYGGILAQQVGYAEESARQALLDEAVYHLNSALDVDNRQSVPEDWAGTRFNGALFELQLARFVADKDSACSYLGLARQFLTEALSVYTAPGVYGRTSASARGSEGTRGGRNGIGMFAMKWFS